MTENVAYRAYVSALPWPANALIKMSIERAEKLRAQGYLHKFGDPEFDRIKNEIEFTLDPKSGHLVRCRISVKQDDMFATPLPTVE